VKAATGMRIGEALALRVSDYRAGTLAVSRSIWNGRETTPKTDFANREIDLSADVIRMLEAFIGDRRQGYLFRCRNGNPLGQRNLLRDSLHPILDGMKAATAGFHGFRRYRVTYLRKQKAPEDLLRFRIGHGDKTVTDRYAKLAEDVSFRKAVAEQVGTGLPSTIFAKIAMLHPVAPVTAHLSSPTQVFVMQEKIMARPERFELPTFWFVARRSIQLS